MIDIPNTVRLRESTINEDVLSLMEHLLNADGFVYATGVPDSFDYVAELGRLGSILPQYDGGLVRDIRPLPGVENDVISASNTRELMPHTEWYEFPGLPPRFVALWCVRPSDSPGGETTLADGHRFIRQFSPVDQAILRHRRYDWRSNPSLATQGVSVSARHPAIEQSGERIVMRFSTHHEIATRDEILDRYISEGVKYFDATKMHFRVARNDILLWDNWRIMHAREAFQDKRRHEGYSQRAL